MDEKKDPTHADLVSLPLSSSSPHSTINHPQHISDIHNHRPPTTTTPSLSSQFTTHSPHLPLPTHTRRQSQRYVRPRGLRIANLFKAWLPIILYAASSLAFVLAIAFWKDQVFDGLDSLSHWLRTDDSLGYLVLFVLIFLTTFPPLPLYSTLITLSGYTWGPWKGALVSYLAALSGAVTVFILSRTFIRGAITRWLARTHSIRRAVRAIERRPSLLFLVRLAPYPYNVMNCLLAASPTLTLKTYTGCTALSLFKVIIHTSIGASMHSFKNTDAPEDEAEDNAMARTWTIVGIGLCVVILLYLSYVARRAVDSELDDDEDYGEARGGEETVAFLLGEGEAESREAVGVPTGNDNMAEAGLGAMNCVNTAKEFEGDESIVL
ncbi:hypothetical protein SERLA73DRAFT_49877 [Serpula lacrymans var. lacrymans S7.3]|uniref:Golgi apparatus membrane protein TVP38 n=2 Tax=Serpula lacrymans var. lacrymans TaxID=341189 RepID=F8PNW7_SERL3|nr:uncharacterized protein SERLADRAFT_346914 [Serpula lacrymans var. lacrymans S7.9]EGO01844.1 hypothetical protein SERLA73DRAFT_49877 [Serpula lacrymans var. lacrymans S7.3]EGO27471.1 hypothetical protein SERLADRAFT_346914 [Serpula lacrymans var. lacrymans S7.9]